MNRAKQIISVLPENIFDPSWWCKLVGITANAVHVGRGWGDRVYVCVCVGGRVRRSFKRIVLWPLITVKKT